MRLRARHPIAASTRWTFCRSSSVQGPFRVQVWFVSTSLNEHVDKVL
jgi:hypothetical protein